MTEKTSEFNIQKVRNIWSFWRDERFLQFFAQAVFVAIITWIGYILYQNLARSLEKQGLTLGFSFLKQTAGFDISDSLIKHERASSNWNAIQVGIYNTILVSLLGNVFSTILGTIIGLARMSKNYLVNRLAWFYIELFRNVPLLLVIIASYSVLVYSLPRVRNAITLPGHIFVSNRGAVLPKALPGDSFETYLLLLVGGMALAMFLALILTKKYDVDIVPAVFSALGFLVMTGIAGWFLLPHLPLVLEFPVKKKLNFMGGITLSPEFIALVIGLVLGSTPFVAEAVRAGLQQVSKGQTEAAQSLGLSRYQTFRLIIFPQALRVTVPPMTSNYLSLTKNSSLAAAIAYPEVFGISGTIINQTGRAIEMMSLIMGIYLTLSLFTSLFMNWYNKKIQLVER